LPGLKAGGAHAFATRVDERKRVVVLAAARSADEAELDPAIRRRVLRRCGLAVDDVVFVPRLPRTSSGKVRRDACRALYLERARD
jgi:acyl-coenzyme A synthetase/AMP-(fatty) acid ligase